MYKESISALAKKIGIKNASVLVTGATGLIGTCVIDLLVALNTECGANIKIYALGRSKERLSK